MQLTSLTDYALRVLIDAAARPESRCLMADFATAFGISRHHVVKVVNELQHLGYLDTTRGREGGFALDRQQATRPHPDRRSRPCASRRPVRGNPLAVHR